MRLLKLLVIGTFVFVFPLSGCGIKKQEIGKLPPRETLIKYCWQTFGFGLKDKNDFVKTNTIHTLGRLGNRSAIDALSSSDYGWKPAVVKNCVLTLAKLHDSAAFYGLYGFANSKDFVVREHVVVGIARMSDLFPDTLVVRHLRKMMHGVDSIFVDTLLYDSTEITLDKNELRAKIGMAMLKVGDPSGLPYLQSLSKNPSVQFRVSMAYMIGEIGPPNSMELILPFLKDPSTYVRSKAVESLIKIKPKDLGARLRSIVAGDKSEDVRVIAAVGLVSVDETAAVDQLLNMLDSEDEDVLTRIILVLGDVKAKPSQDKIIPEVRKLITHSSDWVRISVIATLGSLKDYDSVELIESSLQDHSQEVREISVGVLSRLKGKNMLDDLKKFIKEKEYSMRSVAISGLGSIEDEKLQNEVILPMLLDRLKNDEELIVRVRAAFTILDVLSDRKYTKQGEKKLF